MSSNKSSNKSGYSGGGRHGLNYEHDDSEEEQHRRKSYKYVREHSRSPAEWEVRINREHEQIGRDYEPRARSGNRARSGERVSTYNYLDYRPRHSDRSRSVERSRKQPGYIHKTTFCFLLL